MDDFILRALLAGLGVALMSGTLGCFVVWRSMAYFGDSLSHSVLLGAALGFLWGYSPTLGVLLTSSLFTFLILLLQKLKILPTDTLLGVLAHTALSLGLVVFSLLGKQTFSLESYLFGDILSVNKKELWLIFGASLIILSLIWRFFPSLVLLSLHEDLAKAEGVKVFWMNALLMSLMTIMVATSVKIMGILLIASLLVIPSASARQITTSPRGMVFLATFLGLISVILGIISSLKFDTPTGPSIVLVAGFCFLLLLFLVSVKKLFHYQKHALKSRKK